MKVEIENSGRLTISAENGLEDYALSKWFQDWEQRKAFLCIEASHPIHFDEKTSYQVTPHDN